MKKFELMGLPYAVDATAPPRRWLLLAQANN